VHLMVARPIAILTFTLHDETAAYVKGDASEPRDRFFTTLRFRS